VAEAQPGKDAVKVKVSRSSGSGGGRGEPGHLLAQVLVVQQGGDVLVSEVSSD
jgi:hypothetical protein